MRTDGFDYHLPRELIAQRPAVSRDSSRLMVVDRGPGTVSHHRFADLPGFLNAGDCLVVNTTRVIPARLLGLKVPTGGAVELLLLESLGGDTWRAMAGGATLRKGTAVSLEAGRLEAVVLEPPEDGVTVVELTSGYGEVKEILKRFGRVPLPPYIRGEIPDAERYQTVYSRRELSAAAPTAGLHFTPGLLERMKEAGVSVAGLELAVGMDTFVPVRAERVEDHAIHTEWFSMGEECAAAVNAARERSGRAVAVGTTSVRTLETCAAEAAAGSWRVRSGEGYTDLFIFPGYEFRVVDALITNFHFPRSTLLMLVCAFGGTDLILRAYAEAVRERYRFYSFGDAMLVR